MSSEMVKASRALPAPKNDMAAMVAREIERFIPVLPSSVDVGQMLSALVVASNELEKECTPKSVLMAAYACCQMGLMPGKALGLAYFVPFKGECTLIPGYRGYTELAFRNRFLNAIHPDVVYEGEEFRFWTTEDGPKLMHEPSLDRDSKKDRVVAAYCISILSSGGRQIRVMNKSELAAVDKGEKVWEQHKHEMWLKTVIRRAAKHWRLTRELATAIQLDEQAERDEPQNVGFGDLEPVNGNGAHAPPTHRRRSLRQQEPPPNEGEKEREQEPGADAEIEQPPEATEVSPMVATWEETLLSLNDAAMDAELSPADLTTRVNLWLIAHGAKGKETSKTRVSQRLALVTAVREGRLMSDGKVTLPEPVET